MNSFKKSFLFAALKIAAFLFMLLPIGLSLWIGRSLGLDGLSFFIQKKEGGICQFKDSICLNTFPVATAGHDQGCFYQFSSKRR